MERLEVAMKEVPLIKLVFVCVTMSVIGGWPFLVVKSAFAGALDALHANLPARVQDWTAEPEDRIYDDKTIFSYIDGAGEVYRAYNMRRCLSRRYSISNGPAIVLDIFDMGTSEDAYGVFTHDQDGEELDLGQGALYRPGWLSFWKDRFFISIYMEEERVDAEIAVRELGRIVASLITKEGNKPNILLKLPQEGLQQKSIRYLHHFVVLNYHFYVSDENILNIGPDTNAVLAEYQRGQDRATLLLVAYKNEMKSAEALARFFRYYLPEAGSAGMVLQENGKWSGAAAKGELLVAIFEADSRSFARDLLKGATGIPPQT
jgi:hypothetical protein